MNPYGIDTAEKIKQDPSLDVFGFEEKNSETGSNDGDANSAELNKEIEALRKDPRPHALDALLRVYELTLDDVAKMEEEKVLYPNFLVQQHILVLIGMPGSGKTSLCFYEVCPSLAKNGLDVVYVDADAPALQRKHMVGFANRHGFHYLDPGQVSIDSFMKDLKKQVEKNASFKKSVFFFDTFKKFADILDKKKIKEFFILLRKITKLGGTIVLLGHANKYRNKDGNLTFEGCGDVINDTDELFFLEHRPCEEGGVDCNVLTEPANNAKARGFFENWSFHITPEHEIQLHNKPLDFSQRDERNRAVIETAKRILKEAPKPMTFTALVQHVRTETGFGRTKIQNILHENSSPQGKNDTIFAYESGDRNAKLMRINEKYLK